MPRNHAISFAVRRGRFLFGADDAEAAAQGQVIPRRFLWLIIQRVDRKAYTVRS
uniref:Uncharacterized protein n=1 Tax=Arundo donax TaxID=35708 RepID=A0A0A9AFL9_ARUDO